MAYKAILLFGAPGSGKGTQGKVIGSLPGFFHCSTGDIFRALDKNSEQGKTAASYSSKGLLVPDDFTIGLLKDFLAKKAEMKVINPETDLVILDGVPRNVPQAKLLKGVIDVQKIIHLSVKDPTVMVSRLKGRAMKEGRKDDADETVIRKRMEVYANETQPVLDYYPKSKVVDVEATMSMIRVLNAITGILLPIKESIDK